MNTTITINTTMQPSTGATARRAVASVAAVGSFGPVAAGRDSAGTGSVEHERIPVPEHGPNTIDRLAPQRASVRPRPDL